MEETEVEEARTTTTKEEAGSNHSPNINKIRVSNLSQTNKFSHQLLRANRFLSKTKLP